MVPNLVKLVRGTTMAWYFGTKNLPQYSIENDVLIFLLVSLRDTILTFLGKALTIFYTLALLKNIK